MSSTLGIGVPVPKMLPITGTWTLPFTVYLCLLSQRVLSHRIAKKKYIGDRFESGEGFDSNDNPDPLLLTTRAHANFLENVPLALLLTAIAELNGANRRALNYSLAILLALRLVHVELGLKGENCVGWGRPVGYFGTQGFLAGMAAYGGWLVKGYWGY